MKKAGLLVFAVGFGFGLFFSTTSMVRAEEGMSGMEDSPLSEGGGEPGMMMGGAQGNNPMHHQGKHSKMNPMMMGGGGGNRDSLVATSDGGVVIMQGPRILKYDKDLNLVKEVEIKRGKRPSNPPPQAGSEEDAAFMPPQEMQPQETDVSQSGQ